jgi:hypothetical protein
MARPQLAPRPSWTTPDNGTHSAPTLAGARVAASPCAQLAAVAPAHGSPAAPRSLHARSRPSRACMALRAISQNRDGLPLAVEEARRKSSPKLCPILCPLSVIDDRIRYQCGIGSERAKPLVCQCFDEHAALLRDTVESVGSTTYKPGVAGSKPAPPTSKRVALSTILLTATRILGASRSD